MRRANRIRKRPSNRASLLVPGGIVGGILLAAFGLVLLASPGVRGDRVGGPFRLTDDRGNDVTERSFPGKFLLVYFGYSHCHDVCPATLNALAASLDRLGRKADAVQPLFVTIDPAHDTPSVLRRYVGAFSARLVGLTGSAAEIRKIKGEYGVMQMQRMDGVLDHSSVLYLMSPEGKFVAPIPADASETLMATAIERSIS